MKKAFQKTLIVFFIFILVLVGILIAVIQNVSRYGSLPETMRMVSFSEILIAGLGASILILISVGLTFWLAHAWSMEPSSLGEALSDWLWW